MSDADPDIDACHCDPDDPCFCPVAPTPMRVIRPAAEFVQQARALGARRYPLHGVGE